MKFGGGDMGEYIDIDFNEVGGYKDLTQAQRELFKDTYRLHNSIAGTEYKEGWRPVRVNWVEDKEDARYSYLKVTFKNGGWLHYTQKMTWY